MGKDALYFSHDSNARNDEKILSLLMKHKWEGYGLYWAIIEKLRESTSYKLTTDFNLIAYDLRTSNELVKSIVTGFGLFSIDETEKKFWSNRLLRTMEIKELRSDNARKAAYKKWDDANAMRTQCERNADAMQGKERKGKEGKVSKGKEVKERKEKKGTVFVPPKIEDVVLYFADNGYTEQSAIKAFGYYNVANWHDSRNNPVRNWKQKMQSVWFKDENRIIKTHSENSERKLIEQFGEKALRY